MAKADDPSTQINSAFFDNDGNTTTMLAPTEPCEYQLRYIYAADRSVIATSIVQIEGVPTSLDVAK